MTESFRDLRAWQHAMALVSEVYRATRTFPKHELYGLTSQIRRSAVSVPSNIAEGKGRLSKKEYVQFLSRARGSLCELETQIEVALSLGYVSAESYEALRQHATAAARPLNGLIDSLQDQIDNPES